LAAGSALEEDLVELGWHQREFALRYSYAYTVMTPDAAGHRSSGKNPIVYS
jgi:hypothetical protein